MTNKQGHDKNKPGLAHALRPAAYGKTEPVFRPSRDIFRTDILTRLPAVVEGEEGMYTTNNPLLAPVL